MKKVSLLLFFVLALLTNGWSQNVPTSNLDSLAARTDFIASFLFPVNTYTLFNDSADYALTQKKEPVVVAPKQKKFDNSVQVPGRGDVSQYGSNGITSDVEYSQMVRNMDSVLNSWYVRRSIALHEQFENNQGETTSSVFESKIPDSVYMARLAAIPADFPLVYNDKVRAYIDMYVIRARANASIIMGLTEYYFPIFEQILDEHNLPIELKHLAIIESALNPNARSWAGAVGLFQFMYYTGKMYKLEINTLVDERCDPIKSAHAAAQYLEDMYEVYGDWALVIAAYNCGPGNVNRAIKRSGGTTFWEIYNYLPRETRGYVPAFIGATYMTNYYAEHGIVPVRMEMPEHIDTVMVHQKVSFSQIASVLDISVEQLRDLNPQYKKDIIPAMLQPYALILPYDKTQLFVEKEEFIYLQNETPQTALIATIGTSTSSGQTSATTYDKPEVTGKSPVNYTVQYGDNLGYIATWFNASVSDIKYWNNLYSNMIKVGDKLVVYVPDNQIAHYQKIDGMTLAQKQALIGQSVSSATASVNTSAASQQSASYSASRTGTQSQSSSSSSSDGVYLYYTVRSGDNLWSIAQKFPGVSNADIMNLNGLDQQTSKQLMPGDVIKVKRM